MPLLLLLLRRCCYLLLPPQGAPGASSFILLPLSRSHGWAPAAAGTAEVTAGGAVPSPSPAPCGHRGRSVCVCPRRSGVPCPPAEPVSRSARTQQPRALHLRLGQQRRAGSWHGIGRSVCARLGHVGAGCGVRPGGPRGAGQSAPGLLAVSPAPSAAGGRCLGRNAGRGGVSRRRRLPAAGDSRRSPLSARLQARYRCGFGRSSRFPPLCVQLPVMLSPASSFFYIFDR